MDHNLPETIEGLPNICGAETHIADAISIGASRPVFLHDSGIDFSRIRSAFANALHMHQPLIPCGDDLPTSEIASNLAQMVKRGNDEQRHNAEAFIWCYKRMGEFIPQLVEQGRQPRVMLDYSGTLLWGLSKMGLGHVFELIADNNLRSAISLQGRVARIGLGPSGRALHATTGLRVASTGLAASLRRAVWHGGTATGARLLAGRDGFTKPSGHRL